MAKAVLTFALYQADQLTRRETVTQDIVKVGRDPKSHLRVDDELASRMHAVIEVASPDAITLIDLGNDPGTLLNGSRVNKGRVQAGDQIQIGHTRIVLERTESVAMAAPPPAPAANPFTGASANPFADASAFAFQNPFAVPATPAADEVPLDAPEGSYTYT